MRASARRLRSGYRLLTSVAGLTVSVPKRRERRPVVFFLVAGPLEHGAGLAWMGIEPEREEFRRQGAEIDLAVDDRIRFVLVCDRERLRFFRPPGRGRAVRKRRESDVDLLVDVRRERFQRNDAELGEPSVDGACDPDLAAGGAPE